MFIYFEAYYILTADVSISYQVLRSNIYSCSYLIPFCTTYYSVLFFLIGDAEKCQHLDVAAAAVVDIILTTLVVTSYSTYSTPDKKTSNKKRRLRFTGK